MNFMTVSLHCVNFLAFSAVIALIVHHQIAFLNAESNSTSMAPGEANATALFKKLNATAADDQAQNMLLRQHFREAVNWASNSTGNSASESSNETNAKKEENGHRGNGRKNCTATTALFGHENSTKIQTEKKAKRRRREAESAETVEHFSTENGAENHESGRHSSETSSVSKEEEEKRNSSKANGGEGTQRKGKRDKRAKDEAQREGQMGTEEEGERDTTANCENTAELLLDMPSEKEEKAANAIVESVKNGTEETPEGTKWPKGTEKGNETVETGQDYGKTERNGRNETTAAEGDEGTEGANGGQMGAPKAKGRGERRRRAAADTQELVRQANAQLQNAFGNAQTMAQQQMTAPQVIQLPPADLSNGKAQNILLLSDSGNVSMSRGLHFLTVSTVLQQ